MGKADELARVVDFRDRLVGFVNLVTQNVRRYADPPSPEVVQRIGLEQAWLSQEYGRVYRTVTRYGIAQMTQFGRIASHDVIRDAIGSPTHPRYHDVSQMAIQQLDIVIGHLRAEVEDEPTRVGGTVDLYRLTNPIYWLVALTRLVRRLLGTTRGKVIAAVGTVVLVLIGAFAEAWFSQLLGS